MNQRTYIACDLNNAERKEMPILSVKPIKRAELQKISAFYYIENLSVVLAVHPSYDNFLLIFSKILL